MIIFSIKEVELDNELARIEPVCTFKLGLYNFSSQSEIYSPVLPSVSVLHESHFKIISVTRLYLCKLKANVLNNSHYRLSVGRKGHK